MGAVKKGNLNEQFFRFVNSYSQPPVPAREEHPRINYSRIGATMGSSLIWVILLLPLVSSIACVFLLLFMAKYPPKYKSFIGKLKSQGKYEKWAEENKALVFLESIYRYLGASVILLVVIGFVMGLPALPNNVSIILKIIAYLYWPVLLLLLIMISRLRKNVPELNS